MIELPHPLHADFPHHPLRPHIGQRRERIDPLQPQRLTRMNQASRRSLRSIPSAPHRGRQPPPHFDAWREIRIETDPMQPHETDKISLRHPLHREQPETALGELAPYPIIEPPRLVQRKQSREILHHPRIGIHTGERRHVRLFPFPQQKPGRFDMYFRFHRFRTSNPPEKGCQRSYQLLYRAIRPDDIL